MKCIILAAGEGTRLLPYTKDKPKCMVPIKGVSIIERQITLMKKCGMDEKDICVVTGYRNEVLRGYFRNSHITLIHNERYATTNMVYSLMCARNFFEKDNELIISYGDIVYSKDVLVKIASSKFDISVAVDDEWKEYWFNRFDKPLDDAETLKYDKNNNLVEIGKKTQDINKIMAQYIGLLKFNNKGIEKLLFFTDMVRSRKITLNKKDYKYDLLYFTDLLQGMIDFGYELKALHITRGWYEIDNEKDLLIAELEIDK